MPDTDPTLVARFEAKFTRGDGCWTWTASATAAGYGQMAYKRKPIYAHRLSYEIYVDPIPDGLFVCHTCDNRRCVNPAHLFAGTAADNAADMLRKGRYKYTAPKRPARGERHGRHKLTAQQVSAIRSRYAAGGVTQRQLGKEYGVSGGHICSVIGGRYWAGDVHSLRA